MPQWIQTYLRQLQRFRLQVPQWLIVHIRQLMLQHMNQGRGLRRIGIDLTLHH
jgi:hypothetical protein